MQYVMVIEIPEIILDGDTSIDHAATLVDDILSHQGPDPNPFPKMSARPLSEVIAA